jgi:predicted MFS family arabinose efflux permease
MAQRSEIATIYAAGLVQGVALITYPAAGTVFTSTTGYGLSNTEYGAMFEPDAAMAVIASFLGAWLTSRFGAKRIYLLGLAANLASMTLLVASRFMIGNHAVAYGMLVVATTCLGLGFGCTVPALNTFAAAFFPEKVDKAILSLNALLGLGTALAPVFIALFSALGAWWLLPLCIVASLLILLMLSLPQPLNEGEQPQDTAKQSAGTKFPPRFWLFATFALIYGICETMSGNWGTLFMSKSLGASAFLASVALALFWGTVTAGRILFAFTGRWFPEPVTFRALPLVVAGAFVICACLPKNGTGYGLLAFGLSGLGCSALLPLTISFGQKELTSIGGSVAGGLIAFYQIGFGVAAFGVGPLQARAGLEMNTIYGGAAAIAMVMAILSFAVVRPEKQMVAQISNANT